jgi:hypothetical protein
LSNIPAPTGGDFILYTAADGAVWLAQKALWW